MNLTDEGFEDNISSSVVPVVRSEEEFAISSHVLYIALGSGLGFLVLIVITYYTIYSCRKKNAGKVFESFLNYIYFFSISII